MKNKIEMIDPRSLKAYEHNSRRHSPEQIFEIEESIKEFGFTRPVLISKDNTIIAGHGSVQAACNLAMAEVPCIRLSHLSAEQVRAYVIVDNKLPENSEWDMKTLNIEIKKLSDSAFDLSLLGFSREELDTMLSEKKINLTDVQLSAPKLSWVLVGIPVIKFVEIAEQIDKISAHPDTTVQTTVTN